MPLFCTDTQTLTFSTINFESHRHDIEQMIPHSVRLHCITYNVDSYCSSQELADVTGMHEGDFMTGKELVRSLWHVVQKNKFETITVNCTSTPWGITILLVLRSFWTLSQLKISSGVASQDQYRQYYLIEPCERFDQAMHDHSIEQIKASLYAQGYCDAQVESLLKKDEKTKSVSVHLTIHPGKRFHVGTTTILFMPRVDDVKEDDILELSQRCMPKILDYVRHRRYTKQMIKHTHEHINRCLAEYGFFHADIALQEELVLDKKQVNFHYTIALYPKREFIFVGSRYYTTNQLLDQIIHNGSSACLLPAPLLADELITSYKRKGFLQIHIDTEIDESQSIFIVQEGKRTRIRSITIKGASYYDAEYLTKRFFDAILQRKIFDAELIERSCDRMIEWYVQRGFWQARKISYYMKPPLDASNELIIEMEEGMPMHVRKITNDQPLQDSYILKTLEADYGVLCDIELLENQRRFIEQEARRRGYALEGIKPLISHQEGDVTIHWHVTYAKEHERFGKTIIIGCPALPYHYIQRELTYREGKPYDPALVKQSLMRLRDLDLFDTIQLYPLITDDAERPMMIKIHMDDPYEVRLRWGVGLQQMSTEFTFRSLTYAAGGLFKIKNPFNKADQLRCEVDYKRGMHSVVASYQQPWFLDYPIAMNADIYAVKYLQPGWIEKQHNLYAVLQQGFLCGFTYKSSWHNIGFNLGIEWMETKTTGVPDTRFFNLSLARALNFVPQLIDKKIPYFMVEQTLLLDGTDNKVNPTRGALTLMTLKSMVPLAMMARTSYFVKLYVQQSIFIPCRPFHLLFGFRFGHIFQDNFSSIMPSERFYLGGANSIRSYETDSCPPLGLFVKDGQKIFVPQGAQSLLAANAELRFPIYHDVGGAIFQDVGTLSNTRFSEIAQKDVLAGTGLGLRYNTPIGPLRCDVAFKWRREDPSISRLAWYITFGSVF